MEWIEQNANNASPEAHSNWASEFAITAWWIWRWRCCVVFGRDDEIPTDTKNFLYRQFATTKRALDKFDILTPSRGAGRREVYVRWSPPPYMWVLLNTYGAAKGNLGLAGSGGVFRDDTGNFLSDFYMAIGVCSAMRAELLSLVIGLEEAAKYGYRKLIVRMDNATCVSLILNNELVTNGLRSLVFRCKQLIGSFNGEIVLEHGHREANRAAGWLANKGVNSIDDLVILYSPPLELCSILREDVSGVSFPRVIAN